MRTTVLSANINQTEILHFMKTTIKFFSYISLLLLISTGCKKKFFSTITYEGTVYDSIGGNLMQGLHVDLSACKSPRDGLSQCHAYSVGNATTDANGHFKIEGQEARSNRYNVMIGNGIKVLTNSFSLNKEDLKDPKFTIIYLKD